MANKKKNETVIAEEGANAPVVKKPVMFRKLCNTSAKIVTDEFETFEIEFQTISHTKQLILAHMAGKALTMQLANEMVAIAFTSIKKWTLTEELTLDCLHLLDSNVLIEILNQITTASVKEKN